MVKEFMNIKARLSRLEKHQSSDQIVYFSIPKDLSDEDREQIKSKLWKEFLDQGGSKNALAAFHPGDDPEPHYVRTISICAIKEQLNLTRNLSCK